AQRRSKPPEPHHDFRASEGGASGASEDTVVKEVDEHTAPGIEAIKDAVSSPVATVDGEDKPSAWEKSFDPLAFVEQNLMMKCDSS
ncbi:hypothetical protein A2U01_0080203, partial [Trifolium medium]|nr:hypothetical protein [Trifolium medium]